MPMPVISVAQMRAWEQATWATGQTENAVIDLVGKRLGELVARLTRNEDRILLLAGKGNNGRDVEAAAGYITGRSVDLVHVREAALDMPQINTALARGPALIVDGLFGIGLSRPLDSAWCALVQRVNESGVPILAVDVPSGLDAQTGLAQGAAIQAAITLTVGAPKAGLLMAEAWPYVGRLEVARDVGLIPCPFEEEMRWSSGLDFLNFPPRRPAATHKGSYGHAAIVGGSLGFHGAGVLATRAAQRAQPGLVTLHALESIYSIAAGQLQAAMVTPLQLENKLAGPWSAILIGPGLAGPDVTDELKMLARLLWRDLALPLVVDASALDWLPLDRPPRTAIRVVTPHPGEAARMLRTTPQKVQANRPQALRELSKRLGDAWVVLKGHQTVIGRSNGPVWFNASGNPHLAQGGSGDLLAGYITGLLAQPWLTVDVAQTLRYAVWQHGAAADALQTTRRNWVIEDLAEMLGSIRPEG